jgi:nicotinate-nucleotide adenylyltransferase
MKIIAVFGGSFDPVHKGHMAVAELVESQIKPDELRFLPCHVAPHKNGLHAEAHHRVAMLNLALKNKPYQIDRFEVDKDTVSYSVLSLAALRERVGQDVSICFVIGYDSFQGLHSWKNWQQLPQLANLVVVGRPGYELQLSENIKSVFRDSEAMHSDIGRHACGKLVMLPSSAANISSTELRGWIRNRGQAKEKNKPARKWLNDSVYEYIEQHDLYLG